MQVIVKGKNLTVTEPLKEYTHEKLGKVHRHYDFIREAVVELTVEKNPSISESQHVSVTLFTRSGTLRAEHSSSDMYASIDHVADKLERQVAKLKAKSYASMAASQGKAVGPPLEEVPPEPQIIRSQYAMKPMSLEEAVLELKMLGQEFFVFRNSDTEEVNVLYHRKDGDYGLIEPSV